ncbi:MAG: biotin synthase BioB [Odoribacteraceae bacterium]|jgi:biotin synthase|nr:biotin synthase BioB [Odoribacteraceae bacterium]
MIIERLKQRVLAREGEISREEALELSRVADKERLYAAADEIRERFRGNELDTCSIVNARSGRCSEDCKWCAQSAFHSTGIATYPVKSRDEVLAVARANDDNHVKRFSLVTSGRRVNKTEMTAFCDMYRDIKEKTGLKLCASMGLLGREELLMLKEAGVVRYECNLETASSFFPSLCSTHTTAEKKRTLRLAREVGLEICSGGIIGMGESAEQRVELAIELRELGVKSVPINLLDPVKGTALENRPSLDDEEVLTAIALFRFILPDAFIRFAGGRRRMSRELQRRALRSGINASLVGGLLTTAGTDVAEDYEMFAGAGYTC